MTPALTGLVFFAGPWWDQYSEQVSNYLSYNNRSHNSSYVFSSNYYSACCTEKQVNNKNNNTKLRDLELTCLEFQITSIATVHAQESEVNDTVY